MSKSVIVLITGAPGTGKTTLGKALSKKYSLPFISKDALKELMFDNVGWSDKPWSRKISAASHRIMDYIIEEELKAGHSIIVEGNFKQEMDSQRFRAFQEKYACNIVQILCWAEGEVVYQRYMGRIGTVERHPGHVEEIPPEEIRRLFVESGGRDEPIDIAGTTIELDTTDFASIDYESIYRAIEAAENT